MFTTFTVQPLLRGVHLDDNAGDSGTRPLLGRGSAATGGQPGSSSPGSRSTGIFTRNTRPMIEAMDNFGTEQPPFQVLKAVDMGIAT